jgi:hypothetical protein
MARDSLSDFMSSMLAGKLQYCAVDEAATCEVCVQPSQLSATTFTCDANGAIACHMTLFAGLA